MGGTALAEVDGAACVVTVGVEPVGGALTACDGAPVVVDPAGLSLVAGNGEAIAIRRGEAAMVSADTGAAAVAP